LTVESLVGVVFWQQLLSPPERANAALDRIAVERISELLMPGSSLILSDFPVSRETGKDKDFVVECFTFSQKL
jgi:hypothetical protein